DALQPGPAANLADYHLIAPGKAKKGGKSSSKPVVLTSAVYDPVMDTVTLTPRGAVPKATLQLTITASTLLHASGQPIDGNRDGQPGGNFVATFGNAGIRLAGAPHAGGTVSVQALDSLLVGQADPTSALFETARAPRRGGRGSRG